MKICSFFLFFFLVSLAGAASVDDVVQGLNELKNRGILKDEYITNIGVTQMKCPCFNLNVEVLIEGIPHAIHSEFSYDFGTNNLKLDKHEVKEIKIEE